MGCTETGEFQDGYSKIGCEVRQFYRNVRILFCFVALNTSVTNMGFGSIKTNSFDV